MSESNMSWSPGKVGSIVIAFQSTNHGVSEGSLQKENEKERNFKRCVDEMTISFLIRGRVGKQTGSFIDSNEKRQDIRSSEKESQRVKNVKVLE